MRTSLVVYHRVREMPFVEGNFTAYLNRQFRCKEGAAFNHWVQHYASEVHWAFHTDIDEYFFSPAGTPPGFLRHYLQTLPNTTVQVLLQNMLFLGDPVGPGTHALLERYTLRKPNSLRRHLLPTSCSLPHRSPFAQGRMFFLGDSIYSDTDTLLERYTFRMPNSSQRHCKTPNAFRVPTPPNSSHLLPTPSKSPMFAGAPFIPGPLEFVIPSIQVLIQNIFFLGGPIGPDTDTLLERYTFRMPNSSQRHCTKPIAWPPLTAHLMDNTGCPSPRTSWTTPFKCHATLFPRLLLSFSPPLLLPSSPSPLLSFSPPLLLPSSPSLPLPFPPLIPPQVLVQNKFFLGDPIGPDTDTLLERYTLRMPTSSGRLRTKPIAWLPLAVNRSGDVFISPHQWPMLENGPPRLVDMGVLRLNHYWGDRAGVISDNTPDYTIDVTMMSEYGDGLVKDESAKPMGVWLRQRMQVAWAVISAQAVHKERERLRKRVAEEA
ncbi:unnamed protein product [Closterium sp. Yama58-4]|nr:unnamed protein product [Closterium sp. Yama58-4]